MEKAWARHPSTRHLSTGPPLSPLMCFAITMQLSPVIIEALMYIYINKMTLILWPLNASLKFKYHIKINNRALVGIL